MKTTYLPNDEYDARVAALVRAALLLPSLGIKPSPWTGRIDPDDMKIALGERFDIWPERIIPHLDPEDRSALK